VLALPDTIRIMGDRRYLSQREAAEYLGLSARFVSRETLAGRLPVIRLGEGKALKYAREDLDTYMRERRGTDPPGE
jgi:excisionase family DNA binding protein